jgi:hypothetical protein
MAALCRDAATPRKSRKGWSTGARFPLAHRMGEGARVRVANGFGPDRAQLESQTFERGNLSFRDPL